MQTKIRMVAVAAALVAAGAVQAGVTFDANLEHDLTHKNSAVTNGGRVELNATAALAKSGDNFVNAKATLTVPTGSGSVGIDDAWVQFGNSAVDLKIGRQEATDLFPLGKDVVVEAALTGVGYRAKELRGRFTTGQVHAVAGLNAAAGLRVEIGLLADDNNSGNATGVRPTLVYTNGGFTLRAGGESYKKSGNNFNGTGVSFGYAVTNNAVVNLNYAKQDNANSFGLNAVVGDAGVGVVKDTTGTQKSTVYYAAYSFPLLDVKGATITPAVSTATATGQEKVNAVKVRFNYAF